jgi:DNA-directed RNA polymerase subunit RPC12/RpoP
MTFRNNQAYKNTVYDFIHEPIDVVCPQCSQHALVKSLDGAAEKSQKNIRFTCTNCGHSKTTHPSSVVLSSGNSQPIFGRHTLVGAPLDPYFHLPLWLTTDCCGEVLWAYNDAHLIFLKQLVESKLRERNGQENRNQSLGSRLPRWMLAAKNRNDVLKGISTLQAKQAIR